jgi:hypothetical protein
MAAAKVYTNMLKSSLQESVSLLGKYSSLTITTVVSRVVCWTTEFMHWNKLVKNKDLQRHLKEIKVKKRNLKKNQQMILNL